MAATLSTPRQASSIDDEAPLPYTPLEFKHLSAAYPDLRMELTAEGELVITPPTLGGTGRRHFNISGQLFVWSQADGTGEGFDSNTGFALPNGATRAPDAAWVMKPRWDALAIAVQEEEFVPLAPDFVVELRSKSDRLSTLQKKMREYIVNGVRLGWLIDPRRKCVEVYRPGRDAEILDNPATVSGEDVLRSFVLDMKRIWG